MGNYLGAEVELAKQIRNTCDPSGHEKRIDVSAQLMHKLGLVYVNKTPDKVALVQSVALLNAALARQPNNNEIKDDLSGLCYHVLEASKAKQADLNLVDISKEVMAKVRAMRNAANASLANLSFISSNPENQKIKDQEGRKVKEIDALQNQIAKHYTEILDFISKKCIKVLGSPPCDFALVGLGALASKEVTPYSDFKSILVLKEGVQSSKKYIKCLKYFRWFSAIFQIILLNLQETKLNKIAIPVLNNPLIKGANWFYDKHTISGVSFDGFMSYAWIPPSSEPQNKEEMSLAFEAIKPVSEMVKFLSNHDKLHKDYHLADVSFKYCFISGYKKVYSNFTKAAWDTIVIGRRCHKYTLILHDKLNQEFRNLNANGEQFYLASYNKLNIKQVLKNLLPYFVATTGRLKLTDKSSPFETIKYLREKKFLEAEASRQILFALAVALEARLKESMDRDLQEGPPINFRCGERDEVTLSKLIEFLGEPSLVKYFQVAFALQRIVQDKEVDDWDVNLGPKELSRYKIFIMNLFNMFEHIPDEYKKQLSLIPKSLREDRLFLHIQLVVSNYNNRKFQEALNLLETLESDYSDFLCQKCTVYTQKGKCLYRLKRFREALSCFKKTEANQNLKAKRLPRTLYFDQNLYDVIVFMGLCKLHLRDYKDGLNFFVKALTYLNGYENIALQKCDCKANIGNCYLGLGKIEEAKRKTNQALKLYRDMNAPSIRICNSHHTLGLCYMEEKQYQDALSQFETDYHLRSRLASADSNSEHIKNGLTLMQLAASKLKEEKEREEKGKEEKGKEKKGKEEKRREVKGREERGVNAN